MKAHHDAGTQHVIVMYRTNENAWEILRRVGNPDGKGNGNNFKSQIRLHCGCGTLNHGWDLENICEGLTVFKR